MQSTGIGTALRKARLLRGKSLEEASRETHIRTEYLQALERERFDGLLGDVYVRGFLRSYSTYLGIDPDRILTTYNREFGGLRPILPEQPPGPVKVQAHPLPGHLREMVRHHPSWTVLAVVTFLVIAMLAAVGLLSKSKSSPPPESLGRTPTPPPSSATVTVNVQATADVAVVVTIDGASPRRFTLHRGEGRSFVGASRVDLTFDRGGAAKIQVNGRALGSPGSPTAEFSASFGPQDFRRSPSASSPGR